MKIRILDRSFNTTHYGFLLADSVVEVDKGFAEYAVKKMKAAKFESSPKKKPKK